MTGPRAGASDGRGTAPPPAPGFVDAVLADARITAQRRGDRHEFRSPLDALGQVLRLILVSDALLAQVAYRLEARLRALGIPVLPRLARLAAVAAAQVSIGEAAVVGVGLYLPHGQVVIDGPVEIQSGVAISPWVTVAPIEPGAGAPGPTIERNVRIGTGAKILGPVRVGRGSRVGANAVVLADVPAGATVVGIPARIVEGADAELS